MKIGIVTTWFERGAAVVSRQLRESLEAAGHECFVYARGERYATGDPAWDGPRVRWGKRFFWTGSGKIDQSDFEAWLDETDVSAVLFNEQRWWRPIKWVKRRGLIAAAYVDYYTEEQIDAFGAYDLLICNTERHMSAFSWHSGANYVPWGTNTQLFQPTSRSGELTFFHSCGWDPYRKGTDLVVAAFQAIPQNLDCRLVIHSQRQLTDLKVTDPRIDVIVRTVTAPGLYAMGDVYVYPSRLEGIGLTLCEAAACGLPCIVTDEPPMSEFVRADHTGWLVPVRRRWSRDDGYYWRMAEADISKLSELMIHVAGLDRAEIQRYRLQTRAVAESERDWSKNSVRIGSLFEFAKASSLSRFHDAELSRQDLKERFGFLDRLIDTPLRRPIEWMVELWRLWRQPEMYGSLSK